MTPNARAALLMTLSMASFSCEDTLLKLLSRDIPTGQLLLLVGLAGMLLFGLWLAFSPEGLEWRFLYVPKVLLRNLAEAVAGIAFLTALSIGDLSIASAILQASPLLMTLGAALFLKEPVGWRRWSSIIIGFVGVLLIVRPGSDAFQPASILAVIAVIALAARDLLTRQLPANIGSGFLTASAFGSMAVAGLFLMLVAQQRPVMPSGGEIATMTASLAFGLGGYVTMVIAIRVGEIGAIAPFRYSRLVFAIALAMIVFRERPDALTLTGAAIIAVAGGYAMWRETRLRQTGASESASGMARPG
ncbi:DMT family transporter [Paracoccus seriniphilus]|uniref:EamA-like transporter family protein n=2 Tax=Paracoccus seriniphilus TaxID=184748 RepID=A0A239PWY0_9RHOB|nr:DMT family transporter [Paracoccus seriniphilus]WCR13319.1 DMT family transporter [Paracoccus seriniphilus]SNT74442.1 EamA-like transporter family protein [Paracoccus seriniphilus]